ncbi:MAG: hypothetical protein ACRDNY_12410 [Gaiellaceae bacterium]
MSTPNRTIMNDQLLCGAALAAASLSAVVGGVPWLAVAALAAAIPFLAIGIALALGEARARHDHATGSFP